MGVITVSGGAGVLISDVAEASASPMPEMPAERAGAPEGAGCRSAPRATRWTRPRRCPQRHLAGRTLHRRDGSEGGYESVLGFFSMHRSLPPIGRDCASNSTPCTIGYPDRLFVLSCRPRRSSVRELRSRRLGACSKTRPAR